MDRINLKKLVKEIAVSRPKLFALNSDNVANKEMIDNVEDYYNIQLPHDYKEFVKEYGGGYFGFVVVYSCDENGMFYIKNNVSKQLIKERDFFPVIDLETGDFIGFKIKDGICQDAVNLYSYEEKKLYELEMDFYETLVKYGLNTV